ncbi:hypothetical protein BRO06_12030 [Xanthomonas oryzae pv. oryzae]|nr:hypothetical protein BRO06_12030 [Xanthomonas oryzae pv. oryzae]
MRYEKPGYTVGLTDPPFLDRHVEQVAEQCEIETYRVGRTGLGGRLALGVLAIQASEPVVAVLGDQLRCQCGQRILAQVLHQRLRVSRVAVGRCRALGW